MVETGKRCAWLVGGVLVLAACGGSSKPAAIPPVPPPAPAPAATLAPAAGSSRTGPRCVENFRLFDKDGNGQVSKSEFMAREHWGGDPEQIFEARDANGDGVLSEEEFCSGPRGPHGGRGMPPP